MFSRSNILLYTTVLLCVFQSYSAVYTVSKDGQGSYSSIQAAVDAAQPGDEIVILDSAIYEEQVTIDSTKNHIILRSENPTSSKKPTIRYTDKENVGPKNAIEAQDPEKITFDRNGALRIIKAHCVTVNG